MDRRMTDRMPAAHRQPVDAEALAFEGVRIDTARRRVEVEGREVRLTAKEFELLAHMAAAPGRVFSRTQLLDQVWAGDQAGGSRTVDVHVSWLRSKLRGSDGYNHFRPVRGVGYAFVPRSLRVS
jgi:DNA-binding response OmpR family regulator